MRIKSAARINQIKEYYFSKKLRAIAQMRKDGKEIINLGVGSPDLLAPDTAIDRLQTASLENNVHGYQSYRGIPELRTAFANWYRRFFSVQLDPENEVLPLLGSKEGIMHISMTFLEDGDEVLVPNPGYPAYRSAALLAGAKVVEYRLSATKNWQPDLVELEKRDLEKVKIMWVNYPHMPTGTAADPNTLKALIDFAHKHHILLVNDNPYSFILNDSPFSLLSIDGAKQVALELNSLSKSHNMAGWRVGMLAGEAGYLNEVIKFKSNMDSGMFRAVQLAAVEALHAGASWYKKNNEEYSQRKKLAEAICQALDCTYKSDQVGMFLWANIPPHYKDAYELSDALLYEAGIFITPGGIFGDAGKKFIRLSLCSNRLIFNEALKKIELWTKSSRGSASLA